VALLDGEVTPAQYTTERIRRDDVQRLLLKVVIRPDEAMSKRFPAEMPCHIRIVLKDGQTFNREKQDYEGFYTRPLPWEKAVAKFTSLATPYTDEQLRQSLVETIAHLDTLDVQQLTGLLADVRKRA
jgi:2-methylcitrate dehydratase